MNESAAYVCVECAQRYDVALERVACDCTGVLDLSYDEPEYEVTYGADGGLQRFAAVLPVDPRHLARASLGFSPTPLLAVSVPGASLATPRRGASPRSSTYVKCDYVSPSGSFKDRGAQVLAALALTLDARRVVLDSSGNAGAAMAAHCAHLGLACEVVVPESAPAQKLLQSRAYGARVVAVPGPRSAATARAREMVATPGTFYASHVENPFFLEGTRTWAYEVVEQLGDAPERVVMAVGNGSLFIGAYRGFRHLFERGVTTRVPRMVAAQAKGWSPLRGDLDHDDAAPLADGIAIAAPRRRRQIAAVIDDSRGDVRVVDPAEIVDATRDLASRGLWVEPTSGAAWAAAAQLHDDATTVVSLGGAGFKSSAVSWP